MQAEKILPGRKAAEPLKRVSVFLTVRQLVALRALNEQTGIPVSTMIRQAIDAMLAG